MATHSDWCSCEDCVIGTPDDRHAVCRRDLADAQREIEGLRASLRVSQDSLAAATEAMKTARDECDEARAGAVRERSTDLRHLAHLLGVSQDLSREEIEGAAVEMRSECDVALRDLAAARTEARELAAGWELERERHKRAEATTAALRAAIEGAPHAPECASLLGGETVSRREHVWAACACWKAPALAASPAPVDDAAALRERLEVLASEYQALGRHEYEAWGVAEDIRRALGAPTKRGSP